MAPASMAGAYSRLLAEVDEVQETAAFRREQQRRAQPRGSWSCASRARGDSGTWRRERLVLASSTTWNAVIARSSGEVPARAGFPACAKAR